MVALDATSLVALTVGARAALTPQSGVVTASKRIGLPDDGSKFRLSTEAYVCSGTAGLAAAKPDGVSQCVVGSTRQRSCQLLLRRWLPVALAITLRPDLYSNSPAS